MSTKSPSRDRIREQLALASAAHEEAQADAYAAAAAAAAAEQEEDATHASKMPRFKTHNNKMPQTMQTANMFAASAADQQDEDDGQDDIHSVGTAPQCAPDPRKDGSFYYLKERLPQYLGEGWQKQAAAQQIVAEYARLQAHERAYYETLAQDAAATANQDCALLQQLQPAAYAAAAAAAGAGAGFAYQTYPYNQGSATASGQKRKRGTTGKRGQSKKARAAAAEDDFGSDDDSEATADDGALRVRKKGRNPYIIFNSKIRPELKRQGVPMTQIAARAGEIWRSMSHAEKAPYEAESRADFALVKAGRKELEKLGLIQDVKKTPSPLIPSGQDILTSQLGNLIPYRQRGNTLKRLSEQGGLSGVLANASMAYSNAAAANNYMPPGFTGMFAPVANVPTPAHSHSQTAIAAAIAAANAASEKAVTSPARRTKGQSVKAMNQAAIQATAAAAIALQQAAKSPTRRRPSPVAAAAAAAAAQPQEVVASRIRNELLNNVKASVDQLVNARGALPKMSAGALLSMLDKAVVGKEEDEFEVNADEEYAIDQIDSGAEDGDY